MFIFFLNDMHATCFTIFFIKSKGGNYANNNPAILKYIGITHVLNMAIELKPNANMIAEGRIKYKHIMADDSINYNMRFHFEEAFRFIDDAVRTNGKVLVHCMMGISRSATIVIGYLMSRHKMSLNDAFVLVKRKRPAIQPNPTFMRLLQQYEYELLVNMNREQQQLAAAAQALAEAEAAAAAANMNRNNLSFDEYRQNFHDVRPAMRLPTEYTQLPRNVRYLRYNKKSSLLHKRPL